MDYYNILGVSKSASEQDLKSAFKKKAMQYHPDKGGDEANPNKSPIANNISTEESVHLSMVRHHFETIGSPRAEGTDP
mgnify:CR=1 FL=1